jgi:SHS2 domain-containing protein
MFSTPPIPKPVRGRPPFFLLCFPQKRQCPLSSFSLLSVNHFAVCTVRKNNLNPLSLADDNRRRIRYHSAVDAREPKYSVLEHTADLGLRVRGETLEQLFVHAAEAMLHCMIRVEPFEPVKTVPVGLDGRDWEDLLVRWLGEILYWFQGEKRVTIRARISSLSSRRLEGMLDTISYDPTHQEILCDIKAVTYHQIAVLEQNGVWEATVILDV